MMESEETKRIFRQPINYENGVLLPKIRDISFWRDTDIKSYESGVITLALLLPKDLRLEAVKLIGDTSMQDLTLDGKKRFDDYLVKILELLELNNICFPKVSYEIGHD